MASKVTKLPTKPIAGTVHWLNECIERGQREKFTASNVLLTPGLAGVLLDRNSKNRPIREVKLAQFRADLLTSRWRHNLESIKLHRDGSLADGQHRCTIVQELQIPMTVEVGFGLDDDDVSALDLGAPRSPGDKAAIAGMANPMIITSIARLVIGYESTGGSGLGRASHISTPAVLARCRTDQSLPPAADFAARHKSRVPGVPASVVGFCWYLFASIHHEDANTYMGQLGSGADLKLGDPAYTVREYLIRRTAKNGLSVGRERRIEAIMRGWNAFRDGRSFRSVNTDHARFPGLPDLG